MARIRYAVTREAMVVLTYTLVGRDRHVLARFSRWHRTPQGLGIVVFDGWRNGRPLAPGLWRVSAVARDSDGYVTRSRSVSFRLG